MSKRVLIVDDESSIASVLEEFLEESGYDVKTADSLSSARAEIAQNALPDVVVVDMTLPDGSGTALMDEIRANDRTREIPIILITAHTAEKVTKSSTGSQPDECILKPFSLRDFKARLDRHLKPS